MKSLGVSILLATALVTGCSSTELVSHGPIAQPTAETDALSGVRYNLAKDVVVVQATMTLRTGNELSVNDNGSFSVGVKPATVQSVEATVQMQTVADTSRVFVLDLRPGSSSSDTLSVERSSIGTLKSINIGSKSEAAAVVKSVASVAGALVPIVGALDVSARSKAIDAIAKKMGAEEPALVNEVTAAAVVRSMADAPMEALYMLSKRTDARRLWLKRLTLEHQASKREGDRAEVYAMIPKTAKADIDARKTQVALVEAAVNSAREEVRQATEAFRVLLEDYVKREGLASETATKRTTEVFEVTELPPPDAVGPVGASAPGGRMAQPDRSAAAKQLKEKGFERMAALAREWGVFVTLTRNPLVSTSAGNVAIAKVEKTRLFFRQSFSGELATWALVQEIEEGQKTKTDVVRKRASSIVDVMSPASPMHSIAFDPAYFAERKLGVGFDEKGRIAKLERSSTAALAGATDALATGLQQAQDAYGNALKKQVEFAESRQKLALTDLNAQLDDAKKQKELLEARLALENAAGNFDIARQKSALDAELAALQSKIALANTQAVADQQLEIAQLKAQLEVLQQQLAILKTQLDIAKAKPN